MIDECKKKEDENKKNRETESNNSPNKTRK